MIAKTKENLFRIAAACGGMEDADFKFFIKRKQLPSPFDEGKWADYIRAITGEEPCPICGGPQIFESKLAHLFGSPRGLRCRYVRAHFFQWQLAPIFAKVRGCTQEEMIAIMQREVEPIFDEDLDSYNRRIDKAQASAD